MYAMLHSGSIWWSNPSKTQEFPHVCSCWKTLRLFAFLFLFTFSIVILACCPNENRMSWDACRRQERIWRQLAKTHVPHDKAIRFLYCRRRQYDLGKPLCICCPHLARSTVRSHDKVTRNTSHGFNRDSPLAVALNNPLLWGSYDNSHQGEGPEVIHPANHLLQKKRKVLQFAHHKNICLGASWLSGLGYCTFSWVPTRGHFLILPRLFPSLISCPSFSPSWSNHQTKKPRNIFRKKLKYVVYNW